MSVAFVGGVQLISRPQVRSYADVEPEGVAFFSGTAVGDASLGFVTMLINAAPGFAFRLEHLSAVVGFNGNFISHIQLAHQWLLDASGLPGNANRTQLPMPPGPVNSAGFRMYTLPYSEYRMVRRIPLGDFSNTHISVFLANLTFETNTAGVEYEFHLLCSYWRKDSMTRPGFWEAFMEAPAPRIPGAIIP